MRRVSSTAAAVAIVVASNVLAVGCGSDLLNASVVSWEIIDGCDDGMGILVRFFDEETGAVWPSESSAWVLEEHGSDVFVVDCSRDHVICFGATTMPETSASWGVGLDGNGDCTACCTVCGDGEFPDDTLACP